MGIKEDNFLNIVTIGDSDPERLAQALITRYTISIPEGVHSPDDLVVVNVLLGKLANEKTFLYSLSCYLKMKTRVEKAKGKDHKTGYELYMARREMIDTVLESVKSQYDAVSRMLTAYKEHAEELKILEHAEDRLA